MSIHRNKYQKAAMRPGLRATPRFYLLLTGLILVCFAASCGLNCLRAAGLDRRIEDLNARLRAQMQQLQALKDELDFARTDAYVEQLARSELNLIYPGEIRYIAAGG